MASRSRAARSVASAFLLVSRESCSRAATRRSMRIRRSDRALLSPPDSPVRIRSLATPVAVADSSKARAWSCSISAGLSRIEMGLVPSAMPVAFIGRVPPLPCCHPLEERPALIAH